MKKLPPEDLDLGFSEFLGERIEKKSEEIKAEPSLKELFEAGEYREVSKRAERNFDSSSEAVLWWIRAQIKLNEVPLSILSAPFERVEKDPDPSLDQLIKITAEELKLLTEVEAPKDIPLPIVQKRKFSSIWIVSIVLIGVFSYYHLYSQEPGLWSQSFSPPKPKLVLEESVQRVTVDPLDLVLSQIELAPTPKLVESPVQSLPKPTLDMKGPTLPTREPALTGQREILVDTVVLDRPSIKGEVIARLSQGALVEILGEAGPFFRIRSKLGSDGFVIKQDVGSSVAAPPKPRDPAPISPFSREAVGDRRD